MFHSFKVFDSSDRDRPLKKQFKVDRVQPNVVNFFDLTLHDLELSDDIFTPFQSSESHQYLTLELKEKVEI